MGTGFHGGFGNTLGKRLSENKKSLRLLFELPGGITALFTVLLA